MKKRKGFTCLLLAAAMIFCLPACGKEGEGQTAEVKNGQTVNATLWDLAYDDQDVLKTDKDLR